MKKHNNSIIVLMVGPLLLLPVFAYGQEKVQGPPPTPVTDTSSVSALPVGQPLVPEGVLAVQLVEALKMGSAEDEAQAEGMLSAVGIEPKNGWIAGYPVTPPVIAEVEKGVAAAADAGKLGMGKDQALKAVGELKVRMGLNVTAGAAPHTVPDTRPGNTVIYKFIDKGGVVHFTDRYESIPKEYLNQIEMRRETAHPQDSDQSQTPERPETEESGGAGGSYAANPGAEAINDYYYYEGPPAVTYYAPPLPYYYLYSWVPYPFWYSGYWYSGYFILRDFHRRVYWNNRLYAVTNHVARGVGGRWGMVDPVHRTLGGSVMSNRVNSAQAFRSPGVQANARQIAGMGQGRVMSPVTRVSPAGSGVSVSRSSGRLVANAGGPGGRAGVTRGYGGSGQASGGRSFSSPVARSYGVAPRVHGGPSFSSGRSFSAPSFSARNSFGGYHGGGGSFGGSHGGGSSSGGSRGGGGSRGRR
jgi:hypothetical protein